MSNIISVGQFNKYIHDILLAEEILYNIEIYGEVSGIKLTNGVIYFSIKDSDAVLNCVKFGVKETDYLPKEGESVLVRGTPNYYIKGGRFSFNVNKISPYGVGILYQRFLELKSKLERLGLFDEKKKKPLPKSIKRIGVVTSETGAVIHDIIDISHRRNPTLDIVIYPAKVQGVGAEETIIAGIKAFQETDVDVIIIARGGGSIEDLSCFNEEKLALAIASGIAAGYTPDNIVKEFMTGAKDIFSAALVIGLAAGIITILEDGRIIDTILHSLEEGLDGSGKAGALASMYGIQAVINLAIPSASAKAALTMPIMAPFSDLIGLSRQATVLAFQFGDGFTNMITPCSGVLLAALSVARIPYAEWFKWVWKFILALLLLGFLLLLPPLFMALPGF